MSLPSITKIAEERKANAGLHELSVAAYLENAAAEEREAILVEAMRRDLPLAAERLHELTHEAQKNGLAELVEDPKSELGGQLIRICASDACRPLASKHFCHGLPISFANCCVVRLGTPHPDLRAWQISCQTGPIAFADC